MKINSNFFQKVSIVAFLLFIITFKSYAQNFNNIVNYDLGGTPNNGVKIKTHLPFTSGYEMPTIIIQGYNYATGQTIGLQIVYYVFGSPTAAFIKASISSFGSYTPQVTLANEAGLVVIFIDDKPYFQRFTVSAFAQDRPADVLLSYQNWSVVDEALLPTATNQLLLPYQNSFGGIVNMPGTGIWNASGNVGIGTVNPGSFKLAVRGNVHAQQVNVDMTSWSDYVFKRDYPLPGLDEVKTYIDKNHHLPEIPSEQQIAKNGLDLGEMDKLLTKKVEELTLYLIEKDKQLKDEQEKNRKQQAEIDLMKQQIDAIEKRLSK